ncbi:MAG: hypothetical protein OXF74_07390 [Rhodobacteraceae bacterium]|nr:hypothetical protein [Paracoccaceae bacterium]
MRKYISTSISRNKAANRLIDYGLYLAKSPKPFIKASGIIMVCAGAGLELHDEFHRRNVNSMKPW